MLCQYCGTKLADDTVTCPYCGAVLAAAPGAEAPGTMEMPKKPVIPLAPAHPMKWFKFVIWVQLFLSALISLSSAVSMFSGSLYLGAADRVYSIYPGLKVIDILAGVVFLALAAFAIYIRQQLAHYKENGPKFYLILLVIAAAETFLYALAATIIVGANMFSIRTVIALIFGVVMIVLNNIYFKKRAELFVN